MKKVLLLISVISAAFFTNAQDMMISGIADGPLTGGVPKVIEMYVINDIPDLSIYSLGSAVNGGGSAGQEYTFPADAATAGDFIYVATDSVEFNNFFGFFPNYKSGVANINGDDAVELFENTTVIDAIGDVNVDGTGQAWEHLDGWAYRNNCTGPDNGFVIASWTFSGINQLEGGITNAACTSPFPVGTYNCSGTPSSLPSVSFMSSTGSKMENDATNDTIWVNLSKVAAYTDTVYISANNGTATYTSDFTTTPDLSSGDMFEINAGDSTIMIIVNTVDDAVYEGNENFTLTITSVTDSLSIGSPSTLTYTILENETPPASSFTSIVDIQTPGGGSDSSTYKGDTVFIAGIVTATKSGTGYWVQESVGGPYTGIYVFDGTNSPSEGDSVTVKGTVDEFFGSTQLESVTEFNNISSGNSYVTTVLTADLAGSESYESVMVSISSALVTDIALGFGEFMVDDSNDTIRIDDFIYSYNMPAVNDTLDITGVVAFSFDNWKIYPRDSNDISGASPPVVGDASNNCVGNTVLETYNWKDFEDLNLTSGGWSNQVVTGTTDWRTGSFMGDNYARISNFSGGANTAAETWLISPSMNLSSSTSPQVSFLSLSKFDGAPLKLMVSINYTSGDPNAAAWVDLTSQALWDTDLADWGDWVCSGNVPLSSYKQSNVHIAFKYTGSDSDGTSWELDDIAVFNGDGVFIEEEVSNSFEIYPNPASDKLNIILTQNNNAKINIIDLSGKTVVSQNTKGITNVISIDNLNSGLYFVEVKTENTVERVKFIKK